MKRNLRIGWIFLGLVVSPLFAGWGYEFLALVPDPPVWMAPLEPGVAQSLWIPAVPASPSGRAMAVASWLGGVTLGTFHWSSTDRSQVHLQGLFSGTLEQTDSTGRVVGSFSAQFLYLGYTRQQAWKPGWTLGWGVGLYSQSMASYASFALGGSVGLLWQAPQGPLKAALALTHLGVEIKPLVKERFHPAPQLRGVVAYTPGPAVQIAAGVVASPLGRWLHLSGGYALTPHLRVNLAYTSQWSALKLGDPNDFLMGLMPGLELRWRRFRFAYLYGPMASLGDLHLLSLSLD